MTRGFLLMDQYMNTIIIPKDDDDLIEFFRHKDGYPDNIKNAHSHKNLKDLDQDVRKYLKGEYEG